MCVFSAVYVEYIPLKNKCYVINLCEMTCTFAVLSTVGNIHNNTCMNSARVSSLPCSSSLAYGPVHCAYKHIQELKKQGYIGSLLSDGAKRVTKYPRSEERVLKTINSMVWRI